MSQLRNELLDVFRAISKELTEEDSEAIFEAGILDSLSILELINAIESRFEIVFDEEDLELENFAKLSSIETLVTMRISEQTR